jgi:23S rRNA pseudouridine1911/1915/1917 synthase
MTPAPDTDIDDQPQDASPVTATAPAEAAGGRLDKWLPEAFPDISRSRARALVEEGRLTIDGRLETDPRAKVIAGALYALETPAAEGADAQPEAIPLDILYEDEHLIVVDKPPGLVVHPAPGQWSGTLVNALLHHCGASLSGIGGVARPGIVHRLDKDTSGVMVAAKSAPAHARLVEMFAAHDIERAYVAVTRGAPRPLLGRIETRVARSAHDRKKIAVVRERHVKRDPYSDDPDRQESEESAHGRIAITNYRALETFGRLDEAGSQPASALVECRLETGRTHQIRVHMAHIGAPVLGDPVYGKGRGLKSVGKGPAWRNAVSLADAFPRQALHAAILGFDHPVTGEPMRFERGPPADMAELIEALRRM